MEDAQALTVVDAQLAKREAGSGAMALAQMSAEEFDARLAAVTKAQERVRALVKAIMREGEDFGTIPGTAKPTLLKPGSEKLCAFYGLVATYEKRTEFGDGESRPWITVEVKAIMRLGSADGPIVGEGLGSANSSESKHRYRSAKRTCPACGTVGSISKSKYPDKQTGDIGWWCRDCKANFASDDSVIVDQALGRVVNEDPADVENTCLKMAKKRAYIDGTLTTTATSGFFTQDMEDAPEPDRKAPPETSRTPQPERTAQAEGPGEPGLDDELAQEIDERAAYERHGVEPPAPQPKPVAATGRRGRAPMPECPNCGSPQRVIVSKRPENGKYYCFPCQRGFNAEGGAR